MAATVPSAKFLAGLWNNPLRFAKIFWPALEFYKEQRELLTELVTTPEVFVPAGNMLGKDFSASVAVLHFFLTRHPCRIITTSAKDDHLRVLWGEIGERLRTSMVPLTQKRGGPLRLIHHELRKWYGGSECTLSYVRGMTASPDTIAAMGGHHIANTGDGIPRTLFVCDEASSVPRGFYDMACAWANRMLIIGNTWPTDGDVGGWWQEAVEGGDVPVTAYKAADLGRMTA